MKLTLSTCAVRSFRPGDEPSLAAHANNRSIWRNLRDRFPHPYTEADAADFIQLATSGDPESHFAIAIDDRVVGGVGFQLQTDVSRLSAEFGYWLGEPFWGRGIVTDVARAMVEYGFETYGLRRIYATVYAWNPGSARVLEKAGFEFEGRLRNSIFKDGELTDSLMYAVVR